MSTTDIADSGTFAKPSNKTWKQWFLLYPSFAIAVVGAVPQYIDVGKGVIMGVETGNVADAEQQRQLFIRNMDCDLSLETITTRSNSNVAVGACPSGDIQIDIWYPDGGHVVRWFAFESFTPSHVSLWPSIIKPAVADEAPKPVMKLAQQSIQVICQKKRDKKTLQRRVRIGTECYDQFINIFTGAVQKQTPASCDNSC